MQLNIIVKPNDKEVDPAMKDIDMISKEFNLDFERIPKGTITSTPDFYASSCRCGIRKWKDDICLIYTPLDSCCSGVFTVNKFAAAPVIICREQLKKSRNIKAIVINSGIANACTGSEGLINARNTIDFVADSLKIDRENVLISSTGRIGKQLPMDKIKKGIEVCTKRLNENGGHYAARAILTIDRHTKESAIKITLENSESSNVAKKNEIIISGIAKGSVMVEPNMATTLCFISTNIKSSPEILDELLAYGVNKSFNCITTDGCQSTNDMVILQANGQSSIEIKDKNDRHFNEFKNALAFVLEDLAKKVVEDAEGATKFIEINIINVRNEIEGKKLGKIIANSILFKTAIFGGDINWGRIAAAIGSIDNYIDKDKVDICLDNILVMKAGVAVDYNEESVNNLLRNRFIKFTIDVNSGNERIKILTSDISYDYVKINAFYKKQK